MVAKMSPYFPNEAIQLGDRVQVLPDDGTVPHMPGFRWIHTPGHAPGHISFFRDEDRALIIELLLQVMPLLQLNKIPFTKFLPKS